MASQNRLSQLRKDAITGRWVIFSPARAKRPSDFKSKAPATASDHRGRCPFCSGNEHMRASQIFRVPPDPSFNLKIRVIENLYPALDRKLKDADFDFGGGGGGGCGGDANVLRGFGFHDVVIETPDHSVHLRDLSPREVGDVILAYKKRIEQLLTFDSIKYVQLRRHFVFPINLVNGNGCFLVHALVEADHGVVSSAFMPKFFTGVLNLLNCP